MACSYNCQERVGQTGGQTGGQSSYNCQERVGQTGGQTALPQMEADLQNVARQP